MEVDKEGAAPAEAAVSASVAEPLSVDPAALTEEQQLELALRMSMQDVAPASTSPKPDDASTAMDVDDEAASESALGELVTDADTLQKMMEDDGNDKKEQK